MRKRPYQWKVVPLSKAQLLDVDPRDILFGGQFRKCNVYKSGGGYDKFPNIAPKYFGPGEYHWQFVVQLYGCNLDCPYCYVTRSGVWGNFIKYTSRELVEFFNEVEECTVFHLMGGAPALYLNHWPELIEALYKWGKSGWVFHSDLMLCERSYDEDVLRYISCERCLHAVNIKGVTPEEFLKNTRKPMDVVLIWDNLEKLEKMGVPFYITFTGISPDNIKLFWDMYRDRFGDEKLRKRKGESFSIDIIDYKAIAYNDDVPWGGIYRGKQRFYSQVQTNTASSRRIESVR